MLITLFTDASFSRRHGRGTWAAWFKANGATFRFSGIIRAQLTQSGDAELAALANGLVCVVRTLAPSANDKIIAQLDSAEAIGAVRFHNHPRPYVQAVLGHIAELRKRCGFALDLRHVKGHRGDDTPRSAVNSWCDKECRRRMGELLASLARSADEQQTEGDHDARLSNQ